MKPPFRNIILFYLCLSLGPASPLPYTYEQNIKPGAGTFGRYSERCSILYSRFRGKNTTSFLRRLIFVSGCGGGTVVYSATASSSRPKPHEVFCLCVCVCPSHYFVGLLIYRQANHRRSSYLVDRSYLGRWLAFLPAG